MNQDNFILHHSPTTTADHNIASSHHHRHLDCALRCRKSWMYFDVRLFGRWMRPDFVGRLRLYPTISKYQCFHLHCAGALVSLSSTQRYKSALLISSNSREHSARCFHTSRQDCSSSPETVTIYDERQENKHDEETKETEKAKAKERQAKKTLKRFRAVAAGSTSTTIESRSATKTPASTNAIIQDAFDQSAQNTETSTEAPAREERLDNAALFKLESDERISTFDGKFWNTAASDNATRSIFPDEHDLEFDVQPVKPTPRPPPIRQADHNGNIDIEGQTSSGDLRFKGISLKRVDKELLALKVTVGTWRTLKQDYAHIHPLRDYSLIYPPSLPEPDEAIKGSTISLSHLSWYLHLALTSIGKEHWEFEDLQYIRYSNRHVMERAKTIWMSRSQTDIQNWLASTPKEEDRAKDIVDFLVGSLLRSPQELLYLLSELLIRPHDFEIRAHCLVVFGRLYKSQLKTDAGLWHDYTREVRKMTSPARWPARFNSRNHIRLLLWTCHPRHVTQMLQDFENHIRSFYMSGTGIPDTPNTLLLWLTMFSVLKANSPDQAYRFFSMLSDDFLRSPRNLVQKCCYALLRHDHVVEGPSGPEFRYLTPLLARGLTITSKLYDLIIHMCLNSDHHIVAWDVYRQLESSPIPTKWYTHLQMLRHAMNTNDQQKLNIVLSTISDNKEMVNEPSICAYIMNIVRRLAHTSRNWTAQHAIYQVLRQYGRIYRVQHLRKFGIKPPFSKENDKLIDPPSHRLAYTVWAVVLCHRRPSKAVQEIWTAAVKGLEEQDEIVIACMRHDLIYNAYIWLYAKKEITLTSSLRVLRYMLANTYCAPTDRTWTLILSGFLQHGQHEQAQELYELAKQHGFDLSKVHPKLVRSTVNMACLETAAAPLFGTNTTGQLEEESFHEIWSEPGDHVQQRELMEFQQQLAEYGKFSGLEEMSDDLESAFHQA